MRFMLPETLRNRLGWEMRVYASGGGGEMLVGTASYTGSGSVATNIPGVSGIAPTFTEKSESGITTLVLSSTVKMTRFHNARGTVQVFTFSGSGHAIGERSLIIDEEI
ncbi:hypothetical protein [Ralstonia pseudosolanacearum]|uniref:hypothetical protein n=1 Tax=Ralstonia pseudosolanacearum TaxID=1310165 RepID=UPI001F2441B9|nr:hypothetical protein [Ralstonia pseudosolanacearum]